MLRFGVASTGVGRGQDIDFMTVDGGFEILGATTALPPATGDAVPRLTCRLVQARRG
jgi:hypothetical protein